LYYLCGDVSEELEHFVNTGKRPEQDRGTDKEYHVLPREQEAGMAARWASSGLTVTYHRQQVELVDVITIAYMKVEDPRTNLSVSVIPWFVVVGRPYPIFAYLFAIANYGKAERKSLEESAATVRKQFGISGFHKSTVSRSIRAMEGFIDASRLEQPLAVDALKRPVCLPNAQTDPDQPEEDLVKQISDILAAYPSVEMLERDFGERIRRLPEPIKRTGSTSHALSGIPDEPLSVIIRSKPGGRPSRDRRIRPPRPRAKGPKPVQHTPKFIGYPQREEKRGDFIAICHNLTLNAAIMYHRFLV